MRKVLPLKTPSSILAKAVSGLEACAALAKSHVEGYTRKDGTFVKEHDDKREAAKKPFGADHDGPQFKGEHAFPIAHPAGHQPGDKVFFPHPKKPGKNGLGVYKGQKDGKSVIEHEGKHHEVEHDQVKKPRGLPGNAQKQLLASKAKEAPKAAPKADEDSVMTGDSVHHAGHNKTGRVTAIQGDTVHVVHSGGHDRWHRNDVTKVHED